MWYFSHCKQSTFFPHKVLPSVQVAVTSDDFVYYWGKQAYAQVTLSVTAYLVYRFILFITAG